MVHSKVNKNNLELSFSNFFVNALHLELSSNLVDICLQILKPLYHDLSKESSQYKTKETKKP